jgi:hypothetical protein
MIARVFGSRRLNDNTQGRALTIVEFFNHFPALKPFVVEVFSEAESRLAQGLSIHPSLFPVLLMITKLKVLDHVFEKYSSWVVTLIRLSGLCDLKMRSMIAEALVVLLTSDPSSVQSHINFIVHTLSTDGIGKTDFNLVHGLLIQLRVLFARYAAAASYTDLESDMGANPLAHGRPHRKAATWLASSDQMVNSLINVVCVCGKKCPLIALEALRLLQRHCAAMLSESDLLLLSKDIPADGLVAKHAILLQVEFYRVHGNVHACWNVLTRCLTLSQPYEVTITVLRYLQSFASSMFVVNLLPMLQGRLLSLIDECLKQDSHPTITVAAMQLMHGADEPMLQLNRLIEAFDSHATALSIRCELIVAIAKHIQQVSNLHMQLADSKQLIDLNQMISLMLEYGRRVIERLVHDDEPMRPALSYSTASFSISSGRGTFVAAYL